MKRALFLCPLLLLVACGGGTGSNISFIGVSTGTLASNLQDLNFAGTFPVDEHDLLGVVSFEKPMDGSTIHATWFSPDERRMPLGRSPVVLSSGATVARFSLQSKEDWEPSPFQLRIDVFEPGENGKLTASGSVAFFVGMDDEEISAYMDDFTAWQTADAEERAQWEARKQQDDAAIAAASTILRTEALALSTRFDIQGDGIDEYLIVGKKDEMSPTNTGGGPGIVASTETTVFALMDGSGGSLLSLRPSGRGPVVYTNNEPLYQAIPRGDVTLTLLPTGTISIGWDTDDARCTLEARFSDGAYAADEPVCR